MARRMDGMTSTLNEPETCVLRMHSPNRGAARVCSHSALDVPKPVFDEDLGPRLFLPQTAASYSSAHMQVVVFSVALRQNEREKCGPG
jgi:hypothetical protein